MQKILIVAFIFFSLINSTTAQRNGSEALIIFYNVENLFDTINDPATKDDEFTPNGKKRWDYERYTKKINNIAQVISSIDKNHSPALVGFAEIENKLVLEDLIRADPLRNTPYRIVHEESPDIRGIDVALIYNQSLFEHVSHKSIPVLTDSEYKVRDILYVCGVLGKRDTLHLFVNHWKSRFGGQEQTEPERIICAETLRHSVDSIFKINANANIIIMGDLNDEPDNKSVYEILQANNHKNNISLYNLMLPSLKYNKGTYNYKGDWNILDHIIISNNLLNSNKGYIVRDSIGNIFSPEWISYNNKDGNFIPNKTYGGLNYYGGYSDHYPVFIHLIKQ